jgi:ATP-dependent DNA ligase
MKGYPFEEKRLAKWQPPYIVQPKYDGVRCRAVPLENGSYLLLSSEENVIFSVPHINKALEHEAFYEELDGELYNHEMYLEGGFELIFSVTSRTVNLHPRHEEINFHVFDVVNDQSQMIRNMTVEGLKGKDFNISIAPFWVCDNLEDIKRAYDQLVEDGYEGIIVRHLEAPYVKKRSIYVMKFKPKKKNTYRIVGFNEEISKDGIPKDRLGSLVMSSQTGDEFAVSAGLNDETRKRYWDIRETLIGLNAVVHYQHLTNRKIPKGSFKLEVLFQ